MLGPALPTLGRRRSGYETIAGDQSENRRKREVMKKLVLFIISFSVTHSVENICNICINVRAEGSVSEGRKNGRVPSYKKSTLLGTYKISESQATEGIFLFLFNIKYNLAVCLKFLT